MGTLSNIFSRKRNPSLDTAEKVSRALGMGLENFLLGLRGHVVRFIPGRPKGLVERLPRKRLPKVKIDVDSVTTLV